MAENYDELLRALDGGVPDSAYALAAAAIRALQAENEELRQRLVDEHEGNPAREEARLWERRAGEKETDAYLAIEDIKRLRAENAALRTERDSYNERAAVERSRLEVEIEALRAHRDMMGAALARVTAERDALREKAEALDALAVWVRGRGKWERSVTIDCYGDKAPGREARMIVTLLDESREQADACAAEKQSEDLASAIRAALAQAEGRK